LNWTRKAKPQTETCVWCFAQFKSIPSRGPPSDELVYEPFYDDLPVVEEEDVVY
jgi:hypothetical protein